MTANLQQAQADLAKTTSAAQTAEGEPGADSQCYDAGTAAYDAGSVSYDAGSVAYTAGGVESAITAARDRAQYTSDFQAMLTAESALPSYQPTSPSQGDLNQATATADQSITAALTAANASIDQVNGYVSSAFQTADAAYQGIADCATPPLAPSPQQHIS